MKEVLEEQLSQPKSKVVTESYLKKPTVISTKASVIETKMKPALPISTNKRAQKTNKLHKDVSQKSLPSVASSQKAAKPNNLKTPFGAINVKAEEGESLIEDPPLTSKHHNRVRTGNFNNQ